MSTTDSEQSGQLVDPKLRRLTEDYRKIMEGAPVAFPPCIAELYARGRRESDGSRA